MKKIISMLALAISAFAIVACSDDDNVGSQYQKKSNIVITASNLNFSAKADTGSVTFTAPEAATVRLNSAWATAVLEGNKVKVTVKENNNVEGRATQLTILSGTDSANVTIQQLGMNYEYNGHHLFIYNDEAHAVSYPVVNEGANITLSSSADWAVPTLNNNQVDVALAANNDGHIRLAELYIEAGPYKDTIQVLQGQLKDVVGKQFRFIGYDLAQATSTTHDIRELYAESLPMHKASLSSSLPMLTKAGCFPSTLMRKRCRSTSMQANSWACITIAITSIRRLSTSVITRNSSRTTCSLTSRTRASTCQ